MNPIQLINSITSIRTSISRPSLRCCLPRTQHLSQAETTPIIRGFRIIALVLGCIALSPQAHAVCQVGCDIPKSNTSMGDNVLNSDTTGERNTGTGAGVLFNNTSGGNNTANGFFALVFNTGGSNNTATGSAALSSNTAGSNNTANGVSALQSNTTGGNNTATGISALQNNTTGGNNIAVGTGAGSVLTTGSNNIDIGNAGVAGEAGIIRIGTSPNQTRAFIAGISGVTVGGGVGVVINSNGKLGTVNSSKRFKDEIKPMDKASEAILSLKPVSFRYKAELDPEGIPQFGLVAEEVEKVNPDLVARDKQGKVYTVRYEAVNAMLLNEFLKEHRTVQELKATVAQQQAEIKALSAGLQRVSDRLDKSAARLVVDNQ